MLERVQAMTWDDLTPHNAARFQLSVRRGECCPRERVAVAVDPPAGTPPARRVVASVRWRPQPGEPEREVRLVHWRYKEPSKPHRGFTLIELLVVIAGFSVVLAGTGMLVQLVLEMDGEAHRQAHTIATMGRLAEQFRSDVHQAQGEPVLTTSARTPRSPLPGGTTVRWRIDEHYGLVRHAAQRPRSACRP